MCLAPAPSTSCSTTRVWPCMGLAKPCTHSRWAVPSEAGRPRCDIRFLPSEARRGWLGCRWPASKLRAVHERSRVNTFPRRWLAVNDRRVGSERVCICTAPQHSFLHFAELVYTNDVTLHLHATVSNRASTTDPTRCRSSFHSTDSPACAHSFHRHIHRRRL